MMKNYRLLPLLLFLTAALSGAAQSSLTRTVADAASRTPIAYAYVYHADARRTGTLTNADGRFYLPRVQSTDTLVVSHIGYAPFRVVVGEIAGDTLFLTEKVTTLAEVTILGVDSLSLYELVKANLEKNHGVGPVTYDVFARSFQYDKSNRTLFMIQELFSKVNLNSKNKAKVKFERARSKAFVGEDSIFSSHLVFELLFPFDMEVLDWEIWDKNFLKGYTIELTGTRVVDGKPLLQLELLPKDSLMAAYSLLIDQQTYAVVEQKRYLGYSNGPAHESYFKEVDGIWHLAYLKSTMNTGTPSSNSLGSASILEQVIIFNISEDEPVTKEYKGYLNVLTSTIVNWEKNLDPWDHPFWQTYRNIPLPAWIQKVVGE